MIPSNRSLWLLTMCYVVIIFVTLPIAPYIIKFISRFAKIEFVVNASLLLLFASYCTWMVIKTRRHRLSMLFILAPLAAITFPGLHYIQLPVERIHIAEYGLLSILLYRALRRQRTAPLAALFAIILTSLIGAADEAVQFFLPNRFYSTHDILFNAIGGFVGLCYYSLYMWGSQTQ